MREKCYRDELFRGTQGEKKIGKRLTECSFLLSHIVLWHFKGVFVRAQTIFDLFGCAS